MSDNKRNIDRDDIGNQDDIGKGGQQAANPSQGNQSPTGTGSHAAHGREAAAENADNKAKGNEGRLSGYGKGNTRPETGRN
ncbi:hypothetical protein [Azospirillum sp.]|uniref:hypothetical protein n=1 Tax=Azospirillum sp. TaxID=34012 RepID=UPI002D6177E8|nr:hypothetical protein [Azospirillum sp.]HYD68804.1 hypothetical protein [Azospirillum sp.]